MICKFLGLTDFHVKFDFFHLTIARGCDFRGAGVEISGDFKRRQGQRCYAIAKLSAFYIPNLDENSDNQVCLVIFS